MLLAVTNRSLCREPFLERIKKIATEEKADYLLLRTFACENEGERRPLDAEFVPFLDQRQLALQRALEERYEEAVLLYPAPVLRLWQGASLYARGRYAAAIAALRAACDAADIIYPALP